MGQGKKLFPMDFAAEKQLKKIKIKKCSFVDWRQKRMRNGNRIGSLICVILIIIKLNT